MIPKATTGVSVEVTMELDCTAIVITMPNKIETKPLYRRILRVMLTNLVSV